MSRYLAKRLIKRMALFTCKLCLNTAFSYSVFIILSPTESHPLYDQQPIRFHPQGPIWRDFHTRFGNALPTDKREWLLDSTSLTQRLIKASKHHFSVQVLRQQWGNATLSEYDLLGSSPRLRCLIREVLLLGHEQPWVYARSVIPVSSLTGELRHLRHLDNRPLGQLLFNTPGMQRSPFQIARISTSDLPLYATSQLNLKEEGEEEREGEDKKNKPILWGRRSRFVIYNKPILVGEVFLPAFKP